MARWGDEEQEELKDPEDDDTIVELRTNELGERVKVTKRVKKVSKMVQVNKKVQERKSWKKFGECARAGPGPETGVTLLAEEVMLVWKNLEDPLGKTEKEADVAPQVVCRICGMVGDHWTLKCPYKDKIPENLIRPGNEKEGPGGPGDVKKPDGPGGYVPPHLRNNPGGGGGGYMDRDDGPSLRVTNLSDDATQTDLQELFRPFGRIARISVPRDRTTGMSRGFAFVDFYDRIDAQRAIDKLHGHGYDNLILNVDWAKPSGTR